MLNQMILNTYRDIGHAWKFNENQKTIFKNLYDVNILLIDCLSSDCYISASLRKDIQDSLLL